MQQQYQKIIFMKFIKVLVNGTWIRFTPYYGRASQVNLSETKPTWRWLENIQQRELDHMTSFVAVAFKSSSH